MNKCIVCYQEHKSETVEHIVPRALGNIHYVLKKGVVCSNCNNRFAKYEHVVLNCPTWLERRKKLRLVRNRDLNPGRSPSIDEMAFFLMKMLYEGMYQSRQKVFIMLDFEPIRHVLMSNQKIPFRLIKDKRLAQIISIPSWMDRWRLSQNHINMAYHYHDGNIWFQFRFSDIYNIIELSIGEQ